MKPKSAAVAVLSVLVFSAPLQANDFRQSEDTSEFQGWTIDGSMMAYIRKVNYINLYGVVSGPPELPAGIRNYSMTYAAVQHTKGFEREQFFRISGSTTDVVDIPVERAAWVSGRSIGEWDKFLAGHPFSKPESSPVSPSGRWKIGIRIEGPPVLLSTRVSPFDREMSERDVKGYVLNFGASGPKWGDENGKWTWIGFLDDGKRKIEFHKEDLISTVSKSGGSLFGFTGGYLEAYWSPNEDWVNIQWANPPEVGGGNDKVALYQVRLPSARK